MNETNRQWLLKSRPVGMVKASDFEQGFENAPNTLLRLYSGANFGKQLLEL